MSFFVGLDLGQVNDHTALAIAERIEWPFSEGVRTAQPQTQYHLRHLQRFPLRTSYPEIVAHVKALVSRPELDEAPLAVDHTGVGVAVYDMLEGAALPCPLYGITIHGGDTVTKEGGRYRVPKRDLITLTQVLLQNARLKIAKELPDAATLTKELLDYRLKIDPTTTHDSYNARDGAHDDLVLAVALACWLGEKIGGVMPRVRRL